MRYVALLRGINVGGKNKVDMAALRQTVERVGGRDVSTYINSGNVVFTHDGPSTDLPTVIEDAIEEDLGARHKVLLIQRDSLHDIAAAIPPTWTTDRTQKTDVMFLWDHAEADGLIDRLPIREGIDEVLVVPGAVIWRFDAENATKSGKSRLVGTDLYKAMTLRNSNTVLKVAELLDSPNR